MVCIVKYENFVLLLHVDYFVERLLIVEVKYKINIKF